MNQGEKPLPRVMLVASLGPQPYVGGIQNVVETLLNSRLQNQFQFSVFDTYRKADPHRNRAGKARFAAALAFQIHRRLREDRPELVHIHFCSDTDFWKHAICLLVSRLTGAKVVFHLHGARFDRFYGAKPAPVRLLIRAVFRMPNAVVALSQFWQQFLRGLIDARVITVINNPIDYARLSQPSRSPGATRSHDVLLLGSLGKRKGHYDALKALETVLKSHAKVRVLFAGAEEEPGATEELKRIARERGLEDGVVFLGSLGFEEKLRMIHECAALILPSHAENMPMCVLEAMAAGTPVIASRVGAVPEALAEGEAGHLIEAGDVAGLAEAIISIIDNPALADAMAERAQRRARDLWDVDLVAHQVGTVYRRVLES